MLEAGVRVFCSEGVTPEGRAWLSDGLSRPSIGDAPIPYAARAVTPRRPWRPLKEAENQSLFAPAGARWTRMDIGLLKLPSRVTGPLRALGLSSVRRKADLDRVKSEEGYDSAMAPIVAFVESLHTSSEPVVWHSLHCSPPGLLTVTPTYGDLRLAGLHVDHWDALPLEDLHAARNRICINLGTQDRFFLFVNLDAAEIQRRVVDRRPEKRRDHTSRDPQQDMDSRVSDLCDTFPDYPVVKLRVAPDEAYIAPTEQIIHDGNTEGGASLDIDLMARGHFNPMGGRSMYI